MKLSLSLGLGLSGGSGARGNLIANSDFSAWTGDNPDGFSVIEAPPDSEISEDAQGAHFYAAAPANNTRLGFNFDTVVGRTYRVTMTKIVHTAGFLRLVHSGAIGASSGIHIASSDTTGTFTHDIIAAGTGASLIQIIRYVSGASDYILSQYQITEI